ncbi:uncharacterized protein BCR38DRAFT_405773 [Pseudomassariella vexata]|uniref:Transcription factor Iwr1 domain-containing protein n=1 Tax=Pseudomassariella vexata TaxID=1141098 RepID=A0A1Y2EEY4_9PEZI|nr:uncharacterized protein BCR38DRAFT_405773 [Pseudomassariella vexata]ORY70131.1 hypothetical protein BCR38DRAFT_405773 [Pseudomassariella vexata]
MSIPPQLIRVKRKATEDAPVSYLRVQDNKRHRGEGFVYERQDSKTPVAGIHQPVQAPIIHTSKPGSAGTSFTSQSPRQQNNTGSQGKNGWGENLPPAPASTVGKPEPRRFHMTRQDIVLAASNFPSTRTHGGISKKRPAPTLFVERRIKRLPSKKLQTISHGLNDQAIPNTTEPAPTTPNLPVTVPEPIDVDAGKESRKFKKPGLAKLAKKDGTPKAKAEIPSAMKDRWNVDLDKLTADMNAFTMEQIGLNLQHSEQEKQKRQKPATRTRPKSQSQPRFKPKAPAKRYVERHPEAVEKEMTDFDADADADISDTDDDDYIVETYVRVPASTMETKQVAPQNVGLLVFDAEPDLDLFYNEGTDSDDEYAEDDEDENAENYYTADYPDDEVASDDEFGQNPYSYRTGNASDLEEYDLAADNSSSPNEDSDATNGFKSYIGGNGLVMRHI